MRSPRTAKPLTADAPAPLPIIGSFLLLIGALIGLLALLPQAMPDRVVTILASLTLFGSWILDAAVRSSKSRVTRIMKRRTFLGLAGAGRNRNYGKFMPNHARP